MAPSPSSVDRQLHHPTRTRATSPPFSQARGTRAHEQPRHTCAHSLRAVCLGTAHPRASFPSLTRPPSSSSLSPPRCALSALRLSALLRCLISPLWDRRAVRASPPPVAPTHACSPQPGVLEWRPLLHPSTAKPPHLHPPTRTRATSPPFSQARGTRAHEQPRHTCAHSLRVVCLGTAHPRASFPSLTRPPSSSSPSPSVRAFGPPPVCSSALPRLAALGSSCRACVSAACGAHTRLLPPARSP